ncbi:MAG: 1-acyl-sn-glycerol-3-phosphate acyltransferase, partial [Pirellulaceae bacterium]|nr:1-acyl-sn-glycerol-3-phosphate acyltransferase [Pirellulaceae bacterium]
MSPAIHETRILAVLVLALLAAALVAAGVEFLRRSPYTVPQTLLLAWNRFVTRVLWRTEVRGSFDLPRDQGAVIIANHSCPFDPGFIALGVDRIMHWMVAKEYCKHPLTGPFLRPFAVIPTSRSGQDTAATKMMIRYAESGELVGLFPEGRINDTDRFLLPGRLGTAMVALKARVPIVPCYIEGAPYDKRSILGCLLMPAKARVTFGRPIDLSAYYGRENDREV